MLTVLSLSSKGRSSVYPALGITVIERRLGWKVVTSTPETMVYVYQQSVLFFFLTIKVIFPEP